MTVDPRLDLNSVIRPTLIRLEDSIILNLFERAQHKKNEAIYLPASQGGIEVPGSGGSFFDYLFQQVEAVHAAAGRFSHPQEYPFFKNTPAPIISRATEKSPIQKTDINVNPQIAKMYLEALDKICESGDDTHYGTSATSDIATLQALSRRIHFGIYVAESKYQQDPEVYEGLIREGNTEGIMEKLTNTTVEKLLLKRVAEKGERYHVNPDFISAFYRDKVIPLTKEVEIEYFMKRKAS